MLKIESFTLQGSEGSGNFGQPILIEKIAGIAESLSKISESDAGSDEPGLHHPMDPLFPVQSQAGYSKHELSLPGEPPEAEFSTQAPPKHLQENDVHGRSDLGASPSHHALLELLGSRQTKRPDEPTRNQGPQLTNRLPEAQEQQLSGSQVHLGSTYSKSVCQKAEAGLQKSKFPLHPLAKSAVVRDTRHLQFQPNSSRPQTASLSEISMAPDDVRIESTNTDVSRTSKHDYIDGEKENSQESFTNRSKSIKSKSTKSRLHQTPSTKGPKDYDDPNPWEGLARIPRKFVQIPKDQRTLLNRDDSWYSPAALTRANNSSVPSSVIQNLQAFHGREVSMEVDANNQGDATGTVSDGGSDRECMEPSQKSPDKDINYEELSLPHTVDKQYSSQDESDENSSQPAISWSTSPVRANSPFPYHQIRSRTVTDSGSDSLHSEIPRQERSPVECRAMTPENGVEVTAESDIQSFASTISISKPLRQVPEAKSTKYYLPKSSMEQSSSPVEMPLSVLHALGDQVHSSPDVAMSAHSNIVLPIPSTAEQAQPTLQVQRTPYNKMENRSTLHGTRSPQSLVRISSDPFIPATFGDDAINSVVQTASGSSNSQAQLEDYIISTVRVISSTPTSPTHPGNSGCSSPGQNDGSLAQQQLQAELERLSQRDCDIGAISLVEGYHLSTSFGSEASVEHLQTLLRTQNNIQRSQLKEEMLEPQIMAPQAFQQVDDNMVMIQSEKVKRTYSCASDHFHPAPKRRRTVQAALFATCQGTDTVMDPSEMAKANRRNFLRQLSLKQSYSEMDSIGSNAVRLPSTTSNQFDVASQPSIDNDSHGSSITPPRTQAQHVKPSASSFPDTANSSQLPCTKLGESCGEPWSSGPVGYPSTNVVETPNTEKENNDGSPLGTVASQQTSIIRSSTVMPIEPQDNKDAIQGPAMASISVTMSTNRETPNIFETFQSEYPTYRGSHRSFIRACVYLESVKSQESSPPSALWDDFIRVFFAEYIDYHQECINIREEPMAAVNFYKQYVPEPTFTKCVLTADTLSEALLLNENLTTRYRKLCRQKPLCRMNRDFTTVYSTQLSDSSGPESVHQETSLSSCRSSPRTRQVSRPMSNITDNPPVTDQKIASKQPFFQTASQRRASSTGHKSYSFPPSIKTYPHEATHEATGDGRAAARVSPGNGVGHADTPIRNSRRFPNSQEPLEPTKGGQTLSQANEAIAMCSSIIRRVHQKAWQPTNSNPKLYRLRQASPILGNTISDPILPIRTVTRSSSSPTMRSDVGTCQVSGAKFPHLPASRNFGSRGISLPGPGQSDPDKSRTRQSKIGSFPVTALKNQELLPAAAIESFREFSKVFVPRRKRTSNGSSRLSTPARTLAR
jgi:hypothetical protein